MIRWLVGAIGLCVVATQALAADVTEIGIGYLGRTGVKSKLSLVEQPSENDGIAGARLAIVEQSGHMLPLERPAELARELTAWLN